MYITVPVLEKALIKYDWFFNGGGSDILYTIRSGSICVNVFCNKNSNVEPVQTNANFFKQHYLTSTLFVVDFST